MNVNKYYVYVVVRIGDSFRIQKKRKIRSTTKIIDIAKDNTKSINISTPTFSRKNKSFYVIDSEDGQLTFNKELSKAHTLMLNLLVRKSVISQLTSSFSKALKGMNFILIISLIGFGVGIGWIAKGFFT